MKRTKLIKHMHRHACVFQREGHSHTIYASVDGMRKTAVPRHSEIKPNTVRKICKDMGIPPPDEK
jgi:mRNA interferase HicA